MNPLLLTDGYKLDHRRQYPSNTTLVYSNFTPRSSRRDTDRVVLFGLQYLCMKYFIDEMQENFFQRDKNEVLEEYQQELDKYLGPNDIGTDHIAALHDLGYLPIRIRAIKEGSSVKINQPLLTIENTLPEFFWLTNYFETLISTCLWMPCTSATTSRLTYNMLREASEETCDNDLHLPYQSHDFSMRGISSVESALLSGAGHALYFMGSDAFPVTKFLQKYYDLGDEQAICSVPASEHSVMCMNTVYEETPNDIYAIEKMLDLYPQGIVSIVSDTFDYWRVLTEFLPELKDRIMSRDGKVVIRPDSGHPNLIVNGDPDGETKAEIKGSLNLLGEIFGYTVNEKGYKVLDDHIGLIYGDGCNLEMQATIIDCMKINGWASSNIVFGTGSFAYQFVTRDTEGFAMKATYGETIVNGETLAHNIFKDPATDKNKLKKSHKGLMFLDVDDTLEQEVSWNKVNSGRYEVVFEDSKLIRKQSFVDIVNIAAGEK